MSRPPLFLMLLTYSFGKLSYYVPLFSDKLSLYKSVNSQDVQRCDGEIVIIGCAYLPDGRLVLLDRGFDRKRFLVFDTKYKYIRQHVIDIKQRFDMCISDEETVVHVLGHHDGYDGCPYSCIVSYSMVGDQCEEKNKFDVNNHAKCIALVDDTFIVGCVERMLMYNKHGDEINRIEINGHVSAVCVYPDRTMLYYIVPGTLVCHNVDSGEEVSSNYNPPLRSVTGMCCDRGGNVYCVDRYNHNVQRVSPDFTKWCTVLVYVPSVEGINAPYRMCYHPCKDMFVVTHIQGLIKSGRALFSVYRL